MYRWISVPLLVLLFLAGIGTTFWYFTFGWDSSPDERIVAAGLTHPVQIQRDEQGTPWVTASDEQDAVAGIGYVHGLDRAWTALLWRQIALGRLSEWYGDKAVGFDRFARQLGLAEQAREAYLLLPENEQQILRAYTNGLNAALKSRSVRTADDLALAGVPIETWQPWHSLAVERLFAWLATTPPTREMLAAVDPEVRSFFGADSTFRELLHLHHFEHSLAWVTRDSSGIHLYQRHVYGSSAVPVYAELGVNIGSQVHFSGASLPGTLFLPAGKNAIHSWSLLPVGTLRLEKQPLDSVAFPVVFERIRSNTGSESLISIRRSGRGIQFRAPLQRRVRPTVVPARPDSIPADTSSLADTVRVAPPVRVPPPVVEMVPPDSAWTLSWAGFGTETDEPAWRALLMRGPSPLKLLSGGGLVLRASGQWDVLGQPSVQVNLSRGVLAGNTPWAQYAATGLDSLSVRPENQTFQSILGVTYSAWAARLAPTLVASIDSMRRKPQVMQEALTYLHNWDYSYDRASIAASIFDTWMAEYSKATGQLPLPGSMDTLYFENMRRYQSLLRALNQLTRRYGSDMSQWRWEKINPDLRLFPIWSADSLLSGTRSLASETRFAPVTLPGKGHPSALFWDSSPVLHARKAPAAWEGWVSTGSWSTFYVRRYLFDFSRFLGRYRLSNELPAAIPVGTSNAMEPVTVLVPSSV